MSLKPAPFLLEGVSPFRDTLRDEAIPLDGGCLDCTDSGPDEFVDLVFHFDIAEVIQALGEVEDGEEVCLSLTGNLLDGTPIHPPPLFSMKSPLPPLIKGGNRGICPFIKKGNRGICPLTKGGLPLIHLPPN